LFNTTRIEKHCTQFLTGLPLPLNVRLIVTGDSLTRRPKTEQVA